MLDYRIEFGVYGTTEPESERTLGFLICTPISNEL